MKKKNFFIIFSAVLAVLFAGGVSVAVWGTMSDGNDLPLISYESTWNPEEYAVNGLDIEWINGDVNIVVSSGSVIKITEQSGEELSDRDRLSLSRDDGILKIKWRDALVSFGIFHNKTKALTVEVPKELAKSMEKLECTTTSGEITASGFSAETVRISSTSGGLQLSSISGESADFSTVSGKISVNGATLADSLRVSTTSGEIALENVRTNTAALNTISGAVTYRGTAEEIKANSVSGAVTAELAAAPNTADMNSVSGGLTLKIPQNSGFDAEFSTISGVFKTDFEASGVGSDGASTAKSGRVLCGKGESTLSFATTSGEINIVKK